MPLFRPKPLTRRPGLGAAKLLLAAAATGVGASLLFHSTVGAPPALVRPSVPEEAAPVPTVQAAEAAVDAAKPRGDTDTQAAAADRAERPEKDRKETRDGRGPNRTLARTVTPVGGAPDTTPVVPAPPLTPADPPPVEGPEPAPEPRDEPVPPVELPAGDTGATTPGGESPPTDPTAPPPPPA